MKVLPTLSTQDKFGNENKANDHTHSLSKIKTKFSQPVYKETLEGEIYGVFGLRGAIASTKVPLPVTISTISVTVALIMIMTSTWIREMIAAVLIAT